MTITVYEVCGRRAYRGHAPGSEFAARLDPVVEGRAVARGDIRVIGRVTPDLEPGSFVLPQGWAVRPKQPSRH